MYCKKWTINLKSFEIGNGYGALKLIKEWTINLKSFEICNKVYISFCLSFYEL